ncbi:reverse transcriptase [Hamiltosporidium magnivora]|uniref:Reverse transcriptase n=1 Tax=Hamiltosporidium magnivora TaxID=148818 RepID=A0A4Q9LAF3_9MICR|nr:reverse transcriptase [Hamiltosporidium magnivora]
MIANIERHAKYNSYLLNAKKCFYNTNITIEIIVNNIEIVKQSPIKYLGYYFNLKCADTKKNLKIARTNALKATAILKSAVRKNIFNNSGDIFRYMLRGYISYVRPHIDYPITLLGLNKTFTEDCDRIQKGIIKNLFGIYYKTPSKIIYGIFSIEKKSKEILNGKRTNLYTNFLNNNTKIFKTMKKLYFEHINEEMVQGTTIKFSATITKPKKKNLQQNLEIFNNFKNLKNFNWNTETKERLSKLLEVVNFEKKKKKFEEILELMNDKKIKSTIKYLNKSFLFHPNPTLLNQNLYLKDTTPIANLIQNNKYMISNSKECSQIKTAALGLPQGSILSPSLFNVFINDIIHFIPEEIRKNILLYADDIVIFSERYDYIRKMIKCVSKHAKFNNYILNPKKCFCNSGKEINLSIYNTQIERQNPLKYLGFHFNNRCVDT